MRRHLRRSVTAWTALMLALAGVLVTSEPAYARREDTFSYPFTRVWTTAVRLLRVDFECPITEKDRDEGYFFFEYEDHGKRYPGSVELVPAKVGGVETVRVVIQVPAMPTYVESLMLEKLGRKLLADFGAPQGATPLEVPKPAAPGKPGEPGSGSSPKPGVTKPAAKPAPQG
jgi:hypothetical protein